MRSRSFPKSFQGQWLKHLLFLGVLGYYLGGYLFINKLTAQRNSFSHLVIPFEEELPFVPPLIFAYLLVFFFLSLAYLLIDEIAFFKKVVGIFSLCLTIHFVCFLLFPVEYNLRPAIDPNQGWAYLLVDFYYWLDLPYNCFPSLHVSNAFLIAFLLGRYRPGLGKILHPLAILVAVSVVLVKQHYIADVVGGFLVSAVVYRTFRDKLTSATVLHRVQGSYSTPGYSAPLDRITNLPGP